MLQQELVDLKALQQGGITECQKLVSRVHTDLANLDISLEHKSMGDFDEVPLCSAQFAYTECKNQELLQCFVCCGLMVSTCAWECD